MIKKLLFIVFFLFVTFASVCADVVIYISPNGNDSNLGDKDTPVRSIHKAQKMALPYYGKKKIHFVLMDGVHYLDSTLVITPAMSGNADFPVSYEEQHTY